LVSAPTVALGGATATVAVSASGNPRTVTLSNFSGNGTVAIKIASGSAWSGATAAPAATATRTVTVDTQAPTVAITAPKSLLLRAGDVADFVMDFPGATSVSLSSATKSSVLLTPVSGDASAQVSILTPTTPNATSRTIRLSSFTGNGTLAIAVAAAVATDAAGNTTAAVVVPQILTVDTTPPTATVSAPSQANARKDSTVTYTVTFSGESAIALIAKSVVLTTVTGDAKATATVTGTTGSSRTITLSNFTGNGTIALSVPQGSALDSAGNPSPAAQASGAALTVDTVAPSLSLSAPSAANAKSSSSITYTLTYDGASAISLSASDITLKKTGTADAKLAVSGTGLTTRAITLSSFSGNGSISLAIAANTATDTAGNMAPAIPAKDIITVDTVAPPLTIGKPSKAAVNSDATVTWSLTWRDASSVTLTASDVVLNKTGTANATVAVSDSDSSPMSRVVTLTGFSGNGTIGITIPQGAATDLASNPSPATTSTSLVTVDNTAPTLSIDTPRIDASTPASRIIFPVTYTGADKITLSPADIEVRPTGSATAASITVSPGDSANVRLVSLGGITGSGALAIRLAPGTASDNAGNTAAGSTADSQSVALGLPGGATSITITGVALTSPSGAGASSVNVTLDFTVTTSAIVTVTGSPTFPFTIGGAARNAKFVASTSGTSSLLFRYVTTDTDNGIVAWDAGSLAGGTMSFWSDVTVGILTSFSQGTTTRSVDTIPPDIPVLSTITSNFSAPFNVTVTRVPTPDTTFKEFRYTSATGSNTLVPPADCNSGTSLASGGTIAISRQTTKGNASVSAMATYTMVWPACSTTRCGNTGNGCYDNTAAMAAGTACLVNDMPIELANAAGTFKVWREVGGSRILSASGLWASDADWQRALTRQGSAFSPNYLTNISTIAGRACPTFTFLDRDNVLTRDRCLYYDTGGVSSLSAERNNPGRIES
ncbi:hypothetical protein EBZ70_11740, partial [bacterium]|nr:hypothetical protein [bacterium]